MFRLAVVGDLSGGAPNRLAAVLDHAIGASDMVVQVGDLHAAYPEVKQRLAGGHLFPVPGNHDVSYDSLGVPRNWRYDHELVTVIGFDNSTGHMTPEAWKVLKDPIYTRWKIAACHMAPEPLLSEDGAEITHVMGEGAPGSETQELMMLLQQQKFDILLCGHYHGKVDTATDFGVRMICDGRGGAAPELAFSLLIFTGNKWGIHDIPVQL